jgi:hypothetical protein
MNVVSTATYTPMDAYLAAPATPQENE